MITEETKLSCTVDWLQYTTTEPEFPTHWATQLWDKETGRFGYTRMLDFKDGRVVLKNPDRPEMGNHVIMSGSCLNTIFHDYGVSPFQILDGMARDARVTRIDLAVDIQHGSLDLDKLEQLIEYELITTDAEVAHRFKGIATPGDTIYVGSAQSKLLCRIYDKRAEIGNVDYDWTRIELQARKPKAEAIKRSIFASGFAAQVIPGIISGFVDFPTYGDWRRVFHEWVVPLTPAPKAPNNTLKWIVEVVAPCMARFAVRESGKTMWTEFWKAYGQEKDKLTK